MPYNLRDESNRYERYGLNQDMEEVELGRADDVAQEILRIVKAQGVLKSKDAITLVWNRFGGRYTYTHSMGWMGLRWDVLKILRGIGKGQLLYSTNSRCWHACEDMPTQVETHRIG